MEVNTYVMNIDSVFPANKRTQWRRAWNADMTPD